MGIADLDDAEQLALGGLLRMMIRKDGDFSDAEESRVDAIGEANGGREVVWRVISKSAQELPEDASIRAAAARVTRPEARAFMLDALSQVAAADGTTSTEDAMLTWLRSIW